MSAPVFLKLLVIFAIVAVGWAVARSGRLGSGDPARAISNAAFYVFVPALLFRTTARVEFNHLEPATLLAFFVPTLVLVAVVYIAGRWRERGRPPGAAAAAPSVRAITASFGNTVQIGIPLAAALFGESGLAIHVTIVSVHALTLLTVLTALVELDLAHARRRAEPHTAHLRHVLVATARNTVIHPVVLPVLAGLAWHLGGLPLPGFADEILQTLGAAVVPVCLVLIGVSLAHYGLRGALRSAAALTSIKLLVHPLAVMIAGHWIFGLAGLPLAIVVMMAALPVGSNALIFAQRYDTLAGETSSAIVVSTLGFVLTAPLWLAALRALG